MSKSHVAMEQHACIVCCTPYDTGNILLSTRVVRGKLVEPFDGPHATTAISGLCPKCQKLKDDGFVALVATTSQPTGDTLNPHEAVRTGEVAHIKVEAFRQVFNVEVPADRVAFCDTKVIAYLKKMTNEGGA